ncbi:MAG TPA: hypothetical protein PKN44_10510, partial [Bacteroidales bacterium]|nr:hypothetical protein [Bacteroidales bacterium]HPS63695.1 hypothetical protein [Bacteroidales bacterium]
MPTGTDYPKFTIFNALRWKVLPAKFGGGEDYLWKFKFGWIIHNKQSIKDAALNNSIPPFLLGGVALIEVGGSDFMDWPAFITRSFDWSGPDWMDKYFTILKNHADTSMGAVSIQLRRSAETKHMNPATLNQKDLNDLANELQSDVTNLKIVAAHLHGLLMIDYPSSLPNLELTDEQIKIVGTRYLYGPEKSLDFIRQKAMDSKSYGSKILER